MQTWVLNSVLHTSQATEEGAFLWIAREDSKIQAQSSLGDVLACWIPSFPWTDPDNPVLSCQLLDGFKKFVENFI